MSPKFFKLESNNIDDKNSKYTNIVTLFFDDINDKFTSRKIYSSQKAKFDDQFELEKFTQNKRGSINFDKNLKELCLLNKKNIDLLVLLRCKVSNAIKDLIFNLHEKYSDKYNLNWDKKDMLSFVLEDDGKRSIRPTHNINSFGKKNPVSFNYEFIDSEIERIN